MWLYVGSIWLFFFHIPNTVNLGKKLMFPDGWLFFYLPLLTFSILILLFTLINHINQVSHINYFNHVNYVTNFIPRSLNGNQIKEKEGGRTIHPPLTHHPPQGRILTTFRLFVVARCGQRGRIWTNFRLFFVAGGGGLKSALFT